MQIFILLALIPNLCYCYYVNSDGFLSTTESHARHFGLPQRWEHKTKGYITVSYMCDVGWLYQFNFTYAWYGDQYTEKPVLLRSFCKWTMIHEDLLEVYRAVWFENIEYNFTQRYWLYDDGYSAAGAGWHCDGNCRVIDRFTHLLDFEPKLGKKFDYAKVYYDTYFSYVLQYRPTYDFWSTTPIVCVHLTYLPIVTVDIKSEDIITVRPLKNSGTLWQDKKMSCLVKAFCYNSDYARKVKRLRMAAVPTAKPKKPWWKLGEPKKKGSADVNRVDAFVMFYLLVLILEIN